MFKNAFVFMSDLSAWNVSRAADLSSMFSCARAFTSDLSAWNVSQAASVYFMISVVARAYQLPALLLLLALVDMHTNHHPRGDNRFGDSHSVSTGSLIISTSILIT